MLNLPSIERPRIKIIFIIIIIALMTGVAVLGYLYYDSHAKLVQAQEALKQRNSNVQVLDFMSLFISGVLMADKEVDFETRLKLEGLVRSLDDAEIIGVWKKFVDAPDDNAAQKEAKNLLYLLVSKAK